MKATKINKSKNINTLDRKSSNRSNNRSSNRSNSKSYTIYNCCCLFIIFIIIIYNIYRNNKNDENNDRFKIQKQDNKTRYLEHFYTDRNTIKLVESFEDPEVTEPVEIELIDSINVNNNTDLIFEFHDDFKEYLKNKETFLNEYINLEIYLDNLTNNTYKVFITGVPHAISSIIELFYILEGKNNTQLNLYDNIMVPIDNIINHYLDNNTFTNTLHSGSNITLKIKGNFEVNNIKVKLTEYSVNDATFNRLIKAEHSKRKADYITRLGNNKKLYTTLESNTKGAYENKLKKYGIKYDDKLTDFKTTINEDGIKYDDTYKIFNDYFSKSFDTTLKLFELKELNGNLSYMTTLYRDWYSEFKPYIHEYYTYDLKQKYDVIMNIEESEELKILREDKNVIGGVIDSDGSGYFNRGVIDVGKFDLITDIIDLPSDYTCN
jgi:hypothetical protein